MSRREFPRKVKQAALARAAGHGCAKRGMKSAEYNIWVVMRQRCLNPNDKRYASYGGRGITVCERWDSFAAFLEDMGPRPTPKHSLERKQNDWPYLPSNCEWALIAVQANNRRNNRILQIGEDKITLAQASEKYGIPYSALKCRLHRGWSDMEAVELSPRAQTSGPRIIKFRRAA